MTKTDAKTWTAPKLNKLGSLADVAGAKKTSGDTTAGTHQNS